MIHRVRPNPILLYGFIFLIKKYGYGARANFLIRNISTIKIMTTENGALAHSTTGNKLLDYFTMYVRGLDIKENNKYLEECWAIDPQTTVAIILHGRDEKKEKRVSNEALLWLKKYKPNTYLANLDKYKGYWGDFIHIAKRSKDNSIEVKMFADQLKKDLDALNSGGPVSLCAKWAPSEKPNHLKLLRSIIAELGVNMEQYRKIYLSPLRKHINTVESIMCRGDEIDYDKVPSVAMKKYFKSFMRNDRTRFNQYLAQVKSGVKKMKVGKLLPHEIVQEYSDYNEIVDVLEEQWREIINQVKSSFDDSISVIDVSGSMDGTPMDVAIALGIITAQCCNGEFHNKFITFSTTPQLLDCTRESLYETIKYVRRAPWGGSTDFVATCKLVIDHAKLNNTRPPKRIFVFTDMQFNSATGDDTETIYNIVNNMFISAEYDVPKFIFWNLRATNNFPVTSKDSVILMSGFSEALLKSVMNNVAYDPTYILREIVEKYQPLIKDL